MNVNEFIAKWRQAELRERQACQEHFLDLCELVGHPKPAAFDPAGERFCFERGAKKLGGEDGWADVWRKGYFGWEYKGKRKDLVRERVWPDRKANKREVYRAWWWRHVEARPGMRSALTGMPRFIATPSLTKFRFFVWMQAATLADHQVFAFALAADAALGVLHSRIHEVWARRQGTQLRERESGFRYTPTTCFETFPFPSSPGKEPNSGGAAAPGRAPRPAGEGAHPTDP